MKNEFELLGRNLETLKSGGFVMADDGVKNLMECILILEKQVDRLTEIYRLSNPIITKEMVEDFERNEK